MFFLKDHLDFYGQDANNSPLILSYKIEKKKDIDYIRAILRYNVTTKIRLKK